jgi:RND family efflux transporter MFP subunit
MRKRIVDNILLFGSLLLHQFCSPSNSHPVISDAEIKSTVPATEVRVNIATVKPFEYFISTSGKISSAKEVRVQFKRSGTIARMNFTNGSFIHKGDIGAVIDNSIQQLVLSKAKLLVDEKMIAHQDAMMSYSSLKDSADFSIAKRNIRISSGLASAEIAYQEAKYEYENSFVRAPINGVVSNIEVNEGSAASEGQLFCFIHDPENLMIKAEVLEGDAIQLKKTILAEIRPTSSPEKLYTAFVDNINPRVDPRTGMVSIMLKLDGQARAFPGMNVQVILRLPYNKHIIVPKEALVIRSGRHVVFTVRHKLAKWNYVTIGRENGKEIEIIDGLQSGDSVVIANNLQLAHGAKITVVSE